MGAGAAVALATPASQGGEAAASAIRIVAVSTSPRKGKTTAQALSICLESAKAVNPERIETELIELADLEIPAYVAAGVPLKPGHKDDFPDLAARLVAPQVAGIVVGTPVYFGSMSALCKAFLDRCIALRMRQFALSNKVGGVVAIGGVRNAGGQ